MTERPAQTRFLSVVTATALFVGVASADEVGYEALVARLGAATPTGAGVRVVQVEASEASGQQKISPNRTLAEFAGKSFYEQSGATTTSGHATTVAQAFYSSSASIAPGITQIHRYEAGLFLQGSYLRTATAGSTPFFPPGPSSADRARIFHHSWIGSFGAGNAAFDSEALRRADFAMSRDGTLFICGENNGAGSAMQPLMACGYNGIAVGRSDGQHSAGGTPAANDGPGRMKPELVAPGAFTSFSTPVVSAAAALLYQTADTLPLSLNVNRRQGVTIKSALLCGAAHAETWSNQAPQSGPQRGVTTRPIDPVYGCGTVNVDRAHRIIASDERIGEASVEEAVDSVPHPPIGWDFVVFTSGGVQVHYRFDLPAGADELSALVTWNRTPTTAQLSAAAAAPVIANLRMELLRIEDGVALPIAGDAGIGVFASGNVVSASAIDNIEHIHLRGLAPGNYVLSVTRDDPTSFTSGTGTVSWIIDEPEGLTGDLNADGTVDGIDLGILLGNWAAPGGPADLDSNCTVDGADLGILHGNWG